jgi:hypothetical protein
MFNFSKYVMLYRHVLQEASKVYPGIYTFPFGKYAGSSHLTRLRSLKSHFASKPADIPADWASNPKMLDFLLNFSVSHNDTHILLGPRAALSIPKYADDFIAVDATGTRTKEVDFDLTERQIYALMVCADAQLIGTPVKINTNIPFTMDILNKHAPSFPNCAYFQHPNHILIA